MDDFQGWGILDARQNKYFADSAKYPLDFRQNSPPPSNWFFCLRHLPILTKTCGDNFLKKLEGGENGGGVKILEYAGVAKTGMA